MKTQPKYSALIALVLSAISGVMLALALPPKDVNWLGWVALLPLLIATRITKLGIAVLCGVLTPSVAIRILTGHVDSMIQFGNTAFICLSLAIVFAAVTGISAFMSRAFSPRTWALIVAASAVAIEFVCCRVFPVSVAITQHQSPAALYIASITGIWGVTFLLWLIPAAIIAVAKTPKSAWPLLALPVGLLVFASAAARHEPTGKTITAAAIQAPPTTAAVEETIKAAKTAEIAVWPEHLLEEDSILPAQAAKEAKIYVVSNFSVDSESEKPYNTAKITDPNGKILGTTRKRHLFGNENMLFRPGKSHTIKFDRITAGVPICFDMEYTDVARDLTGQGAEVLFVPNNDPELPNLLINHLHSAVIPFRAAENGVPIVWSESHGASSIFDSNGKELARAKDHQTTHVTAQAHIKNRRTFFTLAGNYFAYICTIATAVAIALSTRKKQKDSLS